MNLNNGGEDMSEENDKKKDVDFLMSKDEWFKLTPEEQAKFDTIQYAHALGQCTGLGLVLGDRLDSEANQKCFAQGEFYAQMASLLRSSNPEQYKKFLDDPREYAKRNWDELFEAQYANIKREPQTARP